MKHPMQKVKIDDQGTARFQENCIVTFLLDAGPFDMNHLARKDFSRADREQFAQLIGYSVSGFSELSYVRDRAYYKAQRKADKAMEKKRETGR